MKEKRNNIFNLIFPILISFFIASCNQSDSGESLVLPSSIDEDSVEDSEWEKIVVDGATDYEQDEEVPIVPEINNEFNYDAKNGDCVNEDGREGTNTDGELICGDYEDKSLPSVELDSEIAYGLDIRGSFVSFEQKIKISQFIKYEILMNRFTYFEDRPNLLVKIKNVYEKRILKILKRLNKWDGRYSKLLIAQSKYQGIVDGTSIVENSKQEFKIKTKLFKINFKIEKIDIKQNRLKIKLKYLDQVIGEL